ncbi:MAG: tRNA (guanosine(37)-N1)-methyltransferase TrmD [Tenericutes bacterium GWC2_34_14]|nr:MAG: tRNA (guanosine(37)-N1)-methyltransferase TrmD [Tenericutes bacterium GWA2_35_7]OHE29722.1 MAG: tRNA (guanosine(37)-N1)-methyltransferase TrmD [Tenericutes bacterium GWC2_34_14]OHE34701.1 MAG: tRNA (guanosine(37)-N1)-methyltransferase TrmD [Tenericutes bacterium GWE2_34_108]OHE37438.1 MAG: tRNA (guanosine(37)-N1)-methyltransferase TrmD [Tenericutes bacterium GWF1_35_14]OHE39427.1 MAG: tRNA (guanosine(37)-N1)-methyltransferase TrmD [Tenericutes bacterium GWF2_35_184]OHE44383.1 MAG: tRNA
MKIDIITIFPDFFDPFLNTSIIKRGIEDGFLNIKTHQLRDYSSLKHNRIDDTPYGGGAGMLMMFPPFYEAIKTLKSEDAHIIMTSPQGNVFDQKKAIELSKKKHLIILCGHYEGIDARVEDLIDEEISIGNYVLTGGEMPAMIISDAVSRLIPGVIHEESSETDSLQQGWLKYPQYTKPESYEGYRVPEILLSGHHQNIESWRKEQSVKRTLSKRPDLIKMIILTEEEKKILSKVSKE